MHGTCPQTEEKRPENSFSDLRRLAQLLGKRKEHGSSAGSLSQGLGQSACQGGRWDGEDVGAPLAPPPEGGLSVAGEPGKFVRKETEGSPLAGDTAVVGWALQLCTHFLVTGGEFSQVVGSNSVCGIHPQSHTSATMLGNGVPPQCRSSAQRHPERPWGTVSRRRDDTGGRVGALDVQERFFRKTPRAPTLAGKY